MCAMLSPKWLTVWFYVCIFVQAVVNLSQVFWTAAYLEMNHIRVFKVVLALGFLLKVGVYSIDLMFLNSTCIPQMATKFLKVMIGRNESRTGLEFIQANIPTGTVSVYPIPSAIIVLLYITSVFIKKYKVTWENGKNCRKKLQANFTQDISLGLTQDQIASVRADNTTASNQIHVTEADDTNDPDRVNELKRIKIINVRPINKGEDGEDIDSNSSDTGDTLDNNETDKHVIPETLMKVPAPTLTEFPALTLTEVPALTLTEVPVSIIVEVSAKRKIFLIKSATATGKLIPDGIGITIGILILTALLMIAGSNLDTVIIRLLMGIFRMLPSYWTLMCQPCFSYCCRKIHNVTRRERAIRRMH